MKKNTNNWEQPLSKYIPYIECNELLGGDLHVWNSARHNNACYELHIVLSGTCSVDIDGRQLTLNAGQAVLIAPMSYHIPTGFSEDFLRFPIGFLFDKDYSDIFIINQNAGITTNCIVDVPEDILSLCRLTINEAINPENAFCEELITANISGILIKSLRLFGLKKDPSSLHGKKPLQGKIITPGKSKNVSINERVIIDDFFEKAITNRSSQKDLALSLHCSERQLSRKLYELYGLSYREKMTQTRSDMAKYLLSNTDKSIDEISALTGYSDESAFYHSFRNCLGMSPGEYRSSGNGNK
ncbi:MAG: AraC family transcriptional regulator [Eubacteriales bacterium]|nr:AraC family transcriptional regulator [Eubacteriales bacterium]